MASQGPWLGVIQRASGIEPGVDAGLDPRVDTCLTPRPIRALGRSSSEGASVSAADPTAGSGDRGRTTMPPMKTILVVDDEPKISQLARDYLEHAGFNVLIAGDGNAALTAVRQRHPDLVVLDLGLPGVDGLDVTRQLRRDSTVPIVMLTARD